MVAILDSPANENYSTRAANAAYCVADESTRTRSAASTPRCIAQQPDEGVGPFPDNAG